MRLTEHLCSLPLAALACSALATTACSLGSSYRVEIDAIAAPAAGGTDPAPPQSYTIVTRNPGLEGDSLRYREVADYVRTALSAKGLYEAPSPERADLVIEIDYGMDAPRVKYETVSNPIIVQEEGRFVERTIIVPVRDPSGNMLMVERIVREYVPGSTNIIGMQETVTPVLVYEKYLRLSARTNTEASEGRPAPEVWSVNVSTEDGKDELRRFMPILASATADYIGTNTKQEVAVRVAEGDEVVSFIRKGM